jgi:hypothetical protein
LAELEDWLASMIQRLNSSRSERIPFGSEQSLSSFVMRGLDPRIHADLPQSKPLRQGRRSVFSAWIAGSSLVEPGNDGRRNAIQVERHMV